MEGRTKMGQVRWKEWRGPSQPRRWVERGREYQEDGMNGGDVKREEWKRRDEWNFEESCSFEVELKPLRNLGSRFSRATVPVGQDIQSVSLLRHLFILPGPVLIPFIFPSVSEWW